MANFTAFLGVMLPGNGVALYSTQPRAMIDDTNTWPLLDYATADTYTWAIPGGTPISDPIGQVAVLTADHATSLMAGEGCVYYWAGTGATHLGDERHLEPLDSASLNRLDIAPGVFSVRETAESVPQAFFGVGPGIVRDTTTPGNLTAIYSELAIFKDVSLPYNPELSNYSITPVMPSGAKAEYTALNGKRQVINYAAPVYQVSMTYTWTGSDYADRLRRGLQKAITDGTPLLFCEPWSGDDVTNRGVYLINLDSAPTITMTSANTYTCTITGTTQP